MAFPLARNGYVWGPNQEVTGELLREFPLGWIAEDQLDSGDITTSGGGISNLCRAQPTYGDSRHVKITVYGRLHCDTVADQFNVTLTWDGSVLEVWEKFVTAGGYEPVSMMATVFPGAPGVSVVGLTVQREFGSGVAAAKNGFHLLVEDCGTSDGAYTA